MERVTSHLSPGTVRRLRILAFRWRRAALALTGLAVLGLLALNALLLLAPQASREGRTAERSAPRESAVKALGEGEHAVSVRIPAHEALPLVPGGRVRLSPADARARWNGRVLSLPPGSSRTAEREALVIVAVPDDAAAEAAAAARQGRLIVTAVR